MCKEVIYLVQFASAHARARAEIYLNEATRPEFDDDVPAEELSIFEAMDERWFAEHLTQISDTQLAWTAEDEESDYGTIVSPLDLRAESALAIELYEYDGPCIAIHAVEDGEHFMPFITLMYDDVEKDTRVEEFNQLVTHKVHTLGSIQAILWLQDYLANGGDVPMYVS
jgi:hypothetical protein